MRMATILSGIRPSGDLHLGNYLGALKQWVALQRTKDHDLFFMLADLHSLDALKDASKMRQSIRETAALYIACGIDPDQSVIFAQSDVSAHTQLMWILSSRVPLGELERMTQFKDKSAKEGSERANAALFNYPILMAADILLYQADLVPVGDDQMQHLEFTRDIARKMNNEYVQGLFTIPEQFKGAAGARVMSLSRPHQKMSKSADDPKGALALLAHNDTLQKNVMSAVTDSEPTITYDPEQRPAVANLLELYAGLTDQLPSDIPQLFEGKGFGAFKQELAERVISTVTPIRNRATDLLNDPALLDDVLKKGAESASARANETLDAVFRATGLRAAS